MPINLPSDVSEVENRLMTDVQNELNEINAFLRNNFLSSLIVGFAGRIFDFTLQQQQIINEMFPDTATGDFLARWGSYKSISRNPASKSSGFITAEGVATSLIPAASQLNTEDGKIFFTKIDTTITNQIVSVSSITRSGQVATVTTATDHNLASGITVTIAGADQTEYNIAAVITVTALDQFTYIVAGSPVTTATGTITAEFDTASIEIDSQDFGQDQNLLAGTKLIFTNPIAGVNNDSFVQFSEVSGGTDIESDEDFRARILEAYQNPIALFNVAAIVRQAKTVPGVTRVFVEEFTPIPGQVTIYFTRDNDTNIIPSAQEVTDVKDALLLIKPAHMDPIDLIVSAPTAVPVNFIFTAFFPATSTMRQSIINSLEQFFRDQTTVGTDLLEDDYRCAINNTVDEQTGAKLVSFTLSTPTGNISIATGELPTLGTVTI